MRNIKLSIIISYLTIYIVWGTTYFAIKIAVNTIPPFYIVGLRYFFGGLLLLIYALLSGKIKRFPKPKELLSSVLIGSLLLVGGTGLVGVAEQRVDSYLTSLIVSCIPIAVIFFDRIILGKKITKSVLLGILMGMTGVGTLLYNGNLTFSSFNSYILIVLLAVTLWSLGTTLSKTLPLPKDSFLNSSIQLFSVGVITLLSLQIFQPPQTVNWSSIHFSSWMAIIYLTLFGSLTLVAYIYLLKNEPNHRVVSYTFINPLIAIFVGLFIGKESPVLYLIPGTLLILFGLSFMFYGKSIISRVFNTHEPIN